MPDEMANRRRLLRFVMLAVLLWGSLLALGSFLFGFDASTGEVTWAPNIWRGAIVEFCVLGFVAAWWFLAARRS
jgi:hypothetical protein